MKDTDNVGFTEYVCCEDCYIYSKTLDFLAFPSNKFQVLVLLFCCVRYNLWMDWNSCSWRDREVERLLQQLL
jgi:hypothetical protein